MKPAPDRMRLNDLFSGVLLFLAGAAVALFSLTFPSTPGAGIGPGVFPLLIGVGLSLCGAVLAWGGRKERGVARLDVDNAVGRAHLRVDGGHRVPRSGGFPTANESPVNPGAWESAPPFLRALQVVLPIGRWVQPRLAFNGALVIAALVFYALAAETVGFFVAGFLFLASLFLAFGVSRRWIAPLAAGVTLGMHVAFYTLLRVPLPWGWLEGMAW